MNGTRQITRAVCDGTGLTQEELGLLVTAAAVVTAVIGVLHAVTALVEAWPVRRAEA